MRTKTFLKCSLCGHRFFLNMLFEKDPYACRYSLRPRFQRTGSIRNLKDLDTDRPCVYVELLGMVPFSNGNQIQIGLLAS